MGHLAFLADEHVDRAYVTALRSSGYRVAAVGEDYEPGIDDEAVFERCQREGMVLLTNDEDFLDLAANNSHAGAVFYQQYGHTPGTIVRAISRMDRYLSSDAFENHVEWLENWL